MKLIADLIHNYDKTFGAVKLEYGEQQFDQVMTFSDFTEMLRTTRFLENDIWLYKDGVKMSESELLVSRSDRTKPMSNHRRFSNEKLWQFFMNEKVGIKINSLYDFSKKLNTFRNLIAKTLLCEVSVNSYYSPVGSEKMLPTHRDKYNILILQLHGEKKFFFGEITDEKMTANKESMVLKAGQALYLPANLAHYAEPTEGHDSFHLTFGLHDLMFKDYLDFFLKGNSQWQLLANKKFPLQLTGEPIKEDLDYIIDQLSFCLKEQLKDQVLLKEFLENNLKTYT